MRRLLLCALALLVLTSCRSRKRPDYMEPRGSAERIERVDTLPDFLVPVRAELETGKVQDAWAAYEAKYAKLFQLTGAQAEDPGDEQLVRLAASGEAVLELVQAFQAGAPADVDAVEKGLGELGGEPPRMIVAYAVTREEAPVYVGADQGRPLVLLNARHRDLATPSQRRATIARTLFELTHQQLFPGPGSLGPLAERVYREGAARFASRILAPEALEHQVLGLTEAKVADARRRERLIAKELLASLDSASEIEEARFFDPALKDPLVPRGSGPYLADKIYQRLAAELQSSARPLQLAPADFLPRARRHLQDIASGR